MRTHPGPTSRPVWGSVGAKETASDRPVATDLRPAHEGTGDMTNDASDGATLAAAGTHLDLPLVEASEGNNGYDISKLLKETGNVTLDSGFVNTASCSSADDVHRRGRRDPPVPGLPHRAARPAEHVPRGRLPPHLRRAARVPASSRTSTPGFAGTPSSTRISGASSRASPGTPTRCRCSPPPSRRCRPSTRTASTRSTRSRSRSPRSGSSRSSRRSPRTRTRRRWGSRSSTRTTRSRSPRTSSG